VHVIATAGHVDHGKSTLVKALTGSDPDRLEEERARGLSIELGYCWTTLPSVGDVAFVDVPGHERFVTTMLSGIGPVPAVLLVVAADDPWMPQAAEHLAALDALGVRHGVVAVTRSDLADPAPMVARSRQEVASTRLAGSPVVAVSAATGAGMAELTDHLVAMVRSLPEPDPSAAVRLWVDRCFHVRGAGTVVTGTLSAGRIAVGDALDVGGRTLRVRGLQSLGRSVTEVVGVARVAVNLAGAERAVVDRQSVLTTPGAWRPADVVDVRLTGAGEPPQRPILHVGATAVATYYRPLSEETGRLTCDRALPLRVGDRALLRDPGSRQVWGVTVLDPAPPPLRRRGAAVARAKALIDADGHPDLAAEVERRGLVRLATLEQIGVPVTAADRARASADGWLLGTAEATRLRAELLRQVRDHDRAEPLAPGLPLTAAAARLGLPSADVAAGLVEPPLVLVRGRVLDADAQVTLPPAVRRAVEAIAADLAEEPFSAPTAGRLQELGLNAKGIGAAAKAGRLLHLGEGIVLLPGADRLALDRLAGLAQPFTTSEARSRLGTTRRVVLPLLQHLDRTGGTRRLPDDRRTVVRSG
jgi:selenocysteine-specific elongation factor